MACLQCIPVLVTIILCTNPWDHGTVLAYSQYERLNSLNKSEDYIDFLNHSSSSGRVNERSILDYTESKNEPRTDSGSSKILNGQERDYVKVNKRVQALNHETDKIFFPGPTVTSNRRFEPEIPAECKDEWFCESVPNYPKEHVDSIVAKLGSRKRMFHVDELYTPKLQIEQRLGATEDNLELCLSTTNVTFPEAVKEIKGDWYYLFNQDSDPLQGFRFERCQKAQSPCADFVSFQPGYEARCIQKYILRNVQVVNKTPGGEMVEKTTKVPSCCSCVAKAVRG